ncbi:RNA recognition motif 2-domain-containing protein [Plectosphaerella plurivora]|uniref:RNA recognition motif 2-domain-containing protein n=1 Tax=Plectosphaerella plurivora TaxID=936078 RepID=A0A9P9A6G5_9PEZI|nr:RNA recognition motif 2-domain-containing protein [Plectosphaerella plurivora]
MEHSASDTYDPVSPHSSSGPAESLKGTPDTRLTAFSPDESSARSSRLMKPANIRESGLAPILFPVKALTSHGHSTDRDPFTTPKSPSASQLSPTASSFQPFASRGDITSDVTPRLTTNRTTLPDDEPSQAAPTISQAIRLSYQDRNVPVVSATMYLERLERFGLLHPGCREVARQAGSVFVRFRDAESAAGAVENVDRYGDGLVASHVPDSEWPCDMQNHESRGQVSILAYAAFPQVLEVQHTESSIHALLQSLGELESFERQPNIYGPSIYTALAQYVNAEDAARAITKFDGRSVDGAVVHLAHAQMGPGSLSLTPSDAPSPGTVLSRSMQNLNISGPPSSVQSAGPHEHPVPAMGGLYPALPFQMQQPFAVWPVMCQTPLQPNMAYVLDSPQQTSHVASPAMGNYQLASPTVSQAGQSAHFSEGYYQPRSMPSMIHPDSRRQHASRVSRSSFYNIASHHNHVDVARIREGTDVRTTIMLRNIPNKVDQAMLKRIVDDSSWGKYDFMYLRIDFANDCNVGYAFINFVDPLDIIDFVNARGNQRWNCFKSDKVAEISYATIQGKDCLVQKFRNSSVMLEAAHYRPKLYYTSNGPLPDLAGQEEMFPAPDNQSKMKRSCENAEHVGLFTPNAGQHFRDEQRRRRSQYDRGTRLAALEEQDFEAAAQPYVQYHHH